MDAKITKVRLNRMLSYDWIKIIAVAVASIIVWTLIFTMTATRITPAQQFTVMNYLGNYSLSADFEAHYAKTFADGVFSYEVLELSSPVDLAGNADMASELLSTRTATSDGDVIFVANADDLGAPKKEKGEDGKEIIVGYENTYLEEFARGYSSMLYKADEFVLSMENYLSDYYKEDGSLDEDYAKTQFRKRVKKDKRFKKESQIRKGEEQELERIRKYSEALRKFKVWLESGYVRYDEVIIQKADDKKEEIKGLYAINICPTDLENGVKNTKWEKEEQKKLEKLISYEKIDEETGEKTKSVENMCVCLFDFSDVTEGFQYESMLYLVSVLEYAGLTA